ncbi:MAG: hypothetical protein OXO48_03600 [Caldilineaceae bacterium]|nr:hypothetical protein [Caldilineaceae bacterium]
MSSESGNGGANTQMTLRELIEVLVSASRGFIDTAERIADSDEARTVESAMQRGAQSVAEFLEREDVQQFARFLNEIPARLEEMDRVSRSVMLSQPMLRDEGEPESNVSVQIRLAPKDSLDGRGGSPVVGMNLRSTVDPSLLPQPAGRRDPSRSVFVRFEISGLSSQEPVVLLRSARITTGNTQLVIDELHAAVLQELHNLLRAFRDVDTGDWGWTGFDPE